MSRRMSRNDRKKLEFEDLEFRNNAKILKKPPGYLNNFGDNYIPVPFSKRLNLKTTVGLIEFNKDALFSLIDEGSFANSFVGVNRFVFTMRWTETNYSLSRFGDATALTEGLHVHFKVGGTHMNLFTNNVIQDNGDFMQVGGHDSRIINDTDSSVKQHQLVSDVDIHEHFGTSMLLDLDSDDHLQFENNENLTAVAYDNITEFSVRVQGIAWVRKK